MANHGNTDASSFNARRILTPHLMISARKRRKCHTLDRTSEEKRESGSNRLSTKTQVELGSPPPPDPSMPSRKYSPTLKKWQLPTGKLED
jgi:hypothetical protein